ncbi:hypothetical protein BGZ75_009160 [Mortierella antarctica]|nr:hypothetical protein BGZ75_009160 [Mortierella antarctica]
MLFLCPLTTATDSVELVLSHVGGEIKVRWEDIERAFPGVERFQDGKSRITFTPAVVNPSKADRVDHHTPREDSPTDAPAEDKVLHALDVVRPTNPTLYQYAVARTSRNAHEFENEQPIASLRAPEVQEPSRASSNLYEAFDRAIKVSHEELTRADVRQEMSNRPFRELMATTTNNTASQEAKNAKLEATEPQQEQPHRNQKEMKQMALLLSYVQAVLTQTCELYEYPTPRLFIVLPQDPARWNSVHVFANKFQLYFLCECGEHTKPTYSRTNIPHHIHLPQHQGYEIARPSEFFQHYGSYVLAILKMLKYGVTVAGVAMPALPQLVGPEVFGQTVPGLRVLQNTIVPGVDQIIAWMDKDEDIGGVTSQLDNTEASGVDLRKLESFLLGIDGSKVLGNLYRTATDKGHAKWVCRDHYREYYNQTAVATFRQAVNSVGGSFDENKGLVKVSLKSRGLAEHFYSALRETRFVHELDICLEMNSARSDLEALENVLKKSTISTLRLDLQHSRPSFSNMLSSTQARYDVLLRIMEHSNMRVIHIVFSSGFLKTSHFSSRKPSHLHKLSFGMVSDALGAKDIRILSEMLRTTSTLTTLDLRNSMVGFNGAQALAEALKANSTLTMLSLESNAIEDGGAQALAEVLTTNSNLISLNLSRNAIGDDGALALSEALKTNSTLVTLNLEDNAIGFNGAQALADSLKVNWTLTTLNLNYSSIGPNGAQALADTIKTNSTLISLSLRYNSIGDIGALALAEALRINSSLSSLDMSCNPIGDEAGQAVLESLRSNSTLITLNLNWNAITLKGVLALAEALQVNSTLATVGMVISHTGCYGALMLAGALTTNSSLTTLILGHSFIGPLGAQALAETIKTNTTLTTLDLSTNPIGYSGAQVLAEMLRTNATLTTLMLSSSAIGYNGAQVLAEALKVNSTLITLDLTNNSIGSNGAQALAETLKTNSSLTILYLDSNSIDDIGIKALAEALTSNSTVSTLGLRRNPIGYRGAAALGMLLMVDRNLTILL